MSVLVITRDPPPPLTSSSSPFAHLQMNAGFLEGVVRGYKAGLLSSSQYNNLTQCENLEGESRMGMVLSNRLGS